MRISRFFTGRSETASMALSKQFPKSVQISIEDTDPPSVHPCACGCCLHRLPVSLPCLCLLRFGSTNNYHRSGRKSTDFSEDRNIFHAVPRALEISILCLLRRSFYTISDIEIQFLRKLRTVKTVLFLAAKKACCLQASCKSFFRTASNRSLCDPRAVPPLASVSESLI